MKKYFFFIGIITALYMSSCAPNKTCPAFQSFYIIDDSARIKQFSLFNEDSVPKDLLAVHRDKNGLIKRMSYRKVQKRWNAIEMEVIMPPIEEIEDSLSGDVVDSLLVAQVDFDETDSLSTGRKVSTRVRRKDHYNYDQLEYNRLFAEFLPKPKSIDTTSISNELGEEKLADGEEEEEPKKKKGFFSFLKRKKKKKEADVAEDSETEAPKKKRKKRKKKKRKKKREQEVTPVEEAPVETDVDEDDQTF